MKKTNIFIIVLFCIIIVYIITIQIVKNRTKHSFRKRVRTLHNLDVSSDIIRDRLSGVGIYYINLNKATERRKDIDTFIQQYEIPNIQRIEGVYGKHVNDNTYTFSDGREIQVTNEYPRNGYNMAELGCFLSHVVALKTAYENGDEYALILEDDVDMNMVKVWDEGLIEVIQKAPENWNIIQLFEHPGGVRANISYKYLKKGAYIPRKTRRHYGCHSYLITRNAMEMFLKNMSFLHTDTIYIKQMDFPFPIDHYLYDSFDGDTIYTTNARFIVNNITNSTQIHSMSFKKNPIISQTSDEKMVSMGNQILKSYL